MKVSLTSSFNSNINNIVSQCRPAQILNSLVIRVLRFSSDNLSNSIRKLFSDFYFSSLSSVGIEKVKY